MKRAAALVAAGIVALSLALVGTAAADDEHHGDDKTCSFGQARGEGAAGDPGNEGTAVINTFGFDVCRTGEKTTDVTGNFRAAGIPPTNGIVLNGPVTCADFRKTSTGKDTVGFIYPIAEGSTVPEVADVLITATDGGPGGQDTIVFTPLPKDVARSNCAPTVLGAPQPVTQGDIVVEPRG